MKRKSHYILSAIIGVTGLGIGCDTFLQNMENRGEVPATGLPSGFSQTKVAAIENGTAMAFAPDGRLFVAEQGGALRVIKDGALLPNPFVKLTVDSAGERGLLGVAFDPNFNSNKYIYLYYTVPSPAHNRVSRFVVNGDVAASGSETVLFELDNLSSASNHNGGALAFGPGGKLFVAVGENNDGTNSQKMTNLLGKMLRLNADGSIPSDNPFYATASGNNRAIWALGLRNPFTFTFQPGTYRMFINDVGQNAWEEIDEGKAGANYGWPTTEGPTTDSRFTAPLYAYGHTGSDNLTIGCAITGGAFYNPGSAMFGSSFVGKYFFADFCNNWIRVFDPATGTAGPFATGVEGPAALLVGSDGSLYYLSRGPGAGVYRVVANTSGAPQVLSSPQSLRVASGQSATFSVTATGSAPLAYQWQRNGVPISGATGSSYTISSAQPSDNGVTYRAIVSNSYGSATSGTATLTVASNAVPVVTITEPKDGMLFAAGDTIRFAGSASDAEDGNLAASRLTWQVDLHHDTHTHPFMAAISGLANGTFVVPTRGETSPNIWYRVYLTAADASNFKTTKYVDIKPRTSIITLGAVPDGLQVTLDGQPMGTPTMVTGVVGMIRTLGIVAPQSLGGSSYVFDRWSDGGAATHEIATSAVNTTYTVTYKTEAPQMTPDAGTTTPDAGTTPPDAGTTTPDAGTTTPDAGAMNPPPPAPMVRTVIFQDGASPSGYRGVSDTSISQRRPTTAYGLSNSLRADGDEPQNSGADMSVIIKWNLASWIPRGSKVTKVELTLNVNDPSWAAYSAHRVIRPWDERTATWTYASSGRRWAGAGATASSDAASEVLFNLQTSRTGSYTVTLTSAAALAAVQDWVDNPTGNQGVIIRNRSAADGLGFRSRETNKAGDRPKLTVTFTTP